MLTYRITIETASPPRGPSDDEPEWNRITTIVCASVFTLGRDLAEWVITEIDHNAEIIYQTEDPGMVPTND